MDITDLHCDLLAYLVVNPDRSPDDPSSRCSTPQQREGGVQKQVLAISSITGIYSLLMGLEQIRLFCNPAAEHPDPFLPAFENASSFALESEPLDVVFNRLERILSEIRPLYISLTWNGENRVFGGGTELLVELKRMENNCFVFSRAK